MDYVLVEWWNKRYTISQLIHSFLCFFKTKDSFWEWQFNSSISFHAKNRTFPIWTFFLASCLYKNYYLPGDQSSTDLNRQKSWFYWLRTVFNASAPNLVSCTMRKNWKQMIFFIVFPRGRRLLLPVYYILLFVITSANSWLKKCQILLFSSQNRFWMNLNGLFLGLLLMFMYYRIEWSQ